MSFSKKDFTALPDPERHPAATAVTPQQIRDAEQAVRAATTPEDRKAAEAIHQALCQAQNVQLQQLHLQREFQQLTRNSHE
jgi:hypothetical protein